jgi:biopolymer transport protein ExbB
MRTIRHGVGVLAGLLVLAMAGQAQAFSPGYYWAELKNWFMAGGNTMWFISLCSIVSVAFTLERLIRLRRKRVAPKRLIPPVRQLWAEQRYDDILRLCRQDGSLLSQAIQILVEHRSIPLADLRTIAADTLNTELRLHFRRIHPLAVSATVAPLLGLFGTVVGMISAFNHFRLLGETGDPTVFAGDISLALITTEAGLMVAIPTLALWHYFRNRTNMYTDELERTVQDLMITWFIEPAKAGAAPAAPSQA